VHELRKEKASADEKHAGESDLGDDEDGADALVLAACLASAGVLEGFLQIAAAWKAGA